MKEKITIRFSPCERESESRHLHQQVSESLNPPRASDKHTIQIRDLISLSFVSFQLYDQSEVRPLHVIRPKMLPARRTLAASRNRQNLFDEMKSPEESTFERLFLQGETTTTSASTRITEVSSATISDVNGRTNVYVALVFVFLSAFIGGFSTILIGCCCGDRGAVRRVAFNRVQRQR